MSRWLTRNKAVDSEGSEEESASDVQSVPPVVAGIQGLQQTAGNQSVQGLLTPNKTQTESESAKLDTLIDSPAKRESAGIHIHTDDRAAKSADSLGAAAYTQGRDIYFGAGKYAPSTSAGRDLLAHELAHALQGEPGQESTADVAATNVVPPGAPSEKEAESAGKSHKTEAPLSTEASHSASAIHLAPLTEAEIAQKLHDAMSDVGTDEKAILDLLKPLNRDAAKIKKVRDAYLAAFRTDLEADIRLELAGEALAQALFHLNAPAPEMPEAPATVVKPGTEQHKAKVGDGEVSVRTDVEYKAGASTRKEGFSVGYTGGKAEDTRWLQFLWAEIVATQADGTAKHVAATALPVTSAKKMDLTTDPAAPKYIVDSSKTDDPFYETGGMNIRTAGSTTIYDRPSEFVDVIKRQFDAGATKVVEKDHFDDFLIREHKTIYRVSLVVTWEYTSKTAIARSTAFQSGAAASALPADLKKVLVKDYPKFDFIQ
ncbi:MAG: DUF4157 domain-containing protein [Acidobacteria bacterium]|nr:DUF4157 domain-containing protein [Acidobacteriota bacterium]